MHKLGKKGALTTAQHPMIAHDHPRRHRPGKTNRNGIRKKGGQRVNFDSEMVQEQQQEEEKQKEQEQEQQDQVEHDNEPKDDTPWSMGDLQIGSSGAMTATRQAAPHSRG